MTLHPDLEKALWAAIDQCHTNVPEDTKLEEHGGWILHKEEVEFKFFFLRNENTGTPRARVLFTANKQDVGKGPLPQIARDGWKNYATFHTHPQFPVRPSQIDWNLLFKNSKWNFIYSPHTKQLGVFEFKSKSEEGETWSQYLYDVVDQTLQPTKTLKT